MTVNDKEWAFLSEQTGMSAPFNDMYFNYLQSLGYVGTLQDMIGASNLGLSPSKNGDNIPTWLTDLNPNAVWGIETVATGRNHRVQLSCARESLGFAQDISGTWLSFTNNEPRQTDLGLLIEPQSTNLVILTNSANPINTTGVTISGDAAAVFSIVDDVAELELAGLSEVCSSGKVFKLDNSAASVTTQAQIATSDNYLSGQFVVSIYVRGSGTGRVRNSSQVPSYTTLPTNYERWSYQNAATPVSSIAARIQIEAGSIAYFILPQFEAEISPTSLIVTTGTTVTRADDNNSLTLPSGTFNATVIFDDDTTQTITSISSGWTIPTNLNRRYIKTIYGVVE